MDNHYCIRSQLRSDYRPLFEFFNLGNTLDFLFSYIIIWFNYIMQRFWKDFRAICLLQIDMVSNSFVSVANTI